MMQVLGEKRFVNGWEACETGLETEGLLIGPHAPNWQIAANNSIIRAILQTWDNKSAGKAARRRLQLPIGLLVTAAIAHLLDHPEKTIQQLVDRADDTRIQGRRWARRLQEPARRRLTPTRSDASPGFS